MADDTQENQPMPEASPKPAPVRSAPKKSAHKRAQHRRTAQPVERAAPVESSRNLGVLVVYVLLGLLVIGTSFYTGYLVGQTGTTPTTGTAKVTIIEYSDFQCPFCSRAVPTVKQLEQTYGDKVEVIFKNFPLEGLHPNALNAAIAAECVRNDGGDDAFWKYHDVLFANQQALDVPNLKQYAKQLGFTIDSCLDNKETESTVRAHMNEAQARGVSGTPSFWVGDELVVGAVPYATLAAKVDEKLSGKVAPAPVPQAPQAPEQPPAKVENLADGTTVLGDKNAPVTIVEFTDYECPFCKRAHDQTFPQIKSQYIDTGKVRYSVRNFPLPFHENAQKAAEAVECAGKQGKFWAYHDAVFASQETLDVASLKKFAVNLGLNTNTFNTCLDNGEMTKLVQDDAAFGSQNGVRGTPSFFVNGNIIVGAQPFTAFQTAIDAELK